MYDSFYKAIALMIILFSVYHLLRLIRNIIEESRKPGKDKTQENRPNDTQ
jgi:hypothetical protein